LSIAIIISLMVEFRSRMIL